VKCAMKFRGLLWLWHFIGSGLCDAWLVQLPLKGSADHPKSAAPPPPCLGCDLGGQTSDGMYHLGEMCDEIQRAAVVVVDGSALVRVKIGGCNLDERALGPV